MSIYVNYPGVSGNNSVGFVSRLEHKFLECNVEAHEKILEVGGGKGDHIPFLNSAFSSYTVLDLFKNENPSGSLNIDYVVGSAEELPFKNSTFDRVILTCVLAHLKDPVLAINEALRVLKIGGTLSILISNDPGVLYTTAWNLFARKSRTEWNQEDPVVGHALSHLISGKSLKIVLSNLSKEHKVKKFGFPFFLPFYNLNLSTVFQIQKER